MGATFRLTTAYITRSLEEILLKRFVHGCVPCFPCFPCFSDSNRCSFFKEDEWIHLIPESTLPRPIPLASQLSFVKLVNTYLLLHQISLHLACDMNKLQLLLFNPKHASLKNKYSGNLVYNVPAFPWPKIDKVKH